MPKATFSIPMVHKAKTSHASTSPAVSPAYLHNLQVANKAASKAIAKARHK